MSKEIMITTADNPYDPFTQWEQWLVFDKLKGYHTPERLAKVAPLSEQLSDTEFYESVEAGIEAMMRYGALDKAGNTVEFKKVIKEAK